MGWLAFIPVVALALFSGTWAQRILVRNSKGFKRTPLFLEFCVASTIGTSTLIALLVLCEIGDWQDASIRMIFWKLSTNILVGLLIFADPIAEFWLITKNINFGSMRFLLIGLMYAVFLFTFYILGNYIPMEDIQFLMDRNTGTNTSSTGTGSASAAASAIGITSSTTGSRTAGPIATIGFIGITLMAILCGISTISAPYIVFFSKRRPVLQSDIDRLESALASTNNLIDTRRENLRTLTLQMSKQSKSSSNLMFKVLTSFKNDSTASEVSALRTEIATMETVRNDLEKDLLNAKSSYESQVFDSTLAGKLVRFFYGFFAVYCIYRLVNILVRLVKSKFKAHGESDALIITVSKMLCYLTGSTDLDGVSKQIGFLISGCLFITSISSVVTTFHKIKKSVSGRGGGQSSLLPSDASSGDSGGLLSSIDCSLSSSSQLTSIFISQIIATYILSTSLLLRSNLPENMSFAITSALGSPLNPDIVQNWSDLIHVWTAFMVVIVLWISIKLDESGSAGVYDEESQIETKSE